MKKLYLPLLCLLLLTACGSRPVHHEERSFAADTWNHFKPETFQFDIRNATDYYNIDLSATIDTVRYRYESLPLQFTLVSPNGERRQLYGTVQMKDHGRWRGEMEGTSNLRTATGRIRSFFSFNAKGDYSLEVSQITSQYDLEGIHQIELTITRAKVDYDL